MKKQLVRVLQAVLDRLNPTGAGSLLSPQQLNQISRSSAQGFFDWDLVADIFKVDENFLAIVGYKPDELVVNTDAIRQLVVASERENTERNLYQAIEHSDVFVLEFRVSHKRGHECWVRTSGTVVSRDSKTGQAQRVVGAMQDITQVKQGERERDEFLQFFEMSSDLMMIGMPDGKFLKVNRATLDTWGYSEAEIYSIRMQDLVHPDDREATAEEFRHQMQTGHTLNFENRCRCKDGSYRWMSYRSSYSQESGLSYATARDITENRRIMEELHLQQERYNALVENTEDVIMEFDRAHRHTYVNKAVIKAVGRSPGDFIGKTHEEMGFPQELCELWEDAIERVFVSGQPFTTYFEANNPGGPMKVDWSVFPGLVVKGEVKSVLNVSRDITQYMKVEEELRRMQKLSSLGVLAGGIAHDFNNILTILFGNIALARSFMPVEHKSQEAMDKAEVAFQRATHLTRQLLTFAKGGEPVKQDVSIGALIEEVVKFDLSGSNVKLVFNAPDNLWHASVDKGQISQVFSNLATNANQAMPQGGHLYITIENCVLDRHEVPALEAGNYLKFVVNDEGTGIAEDNLDKIFDPYFTTKEKGSGLGLATVHSIVTRHEGHISVESTPGKGAAFIVYLPASHDTADPIDTTHNIQPVTVREHARILVMDDEDMICQLCEAYLTTQGYSVDSARDGQQAIRLYEQALAEGNAYDCLIMDLTIPGGMSGKEALEQIHLLNPLARAIVSSGYAADPVMANFREHGFRGFIPKPFQLSTLLGEIKRVLAEPADYLQ